MSTTRLGFTVIELLAVLAILTVVAATTLPPVQFARKTSSTPTLPVLQLPVAEFNDANPEKFAVVEGKPGEREVPKFEAGKKLAVEIKLKPIGEFTPATFIVRFVEPPVEAIHQSLIAAWVKEADGLHVFRGETTAPPRAGEYTVEAVYIKGKETQPVLSRTKVRILDLQQN